LSAAKTAVFFAGKRNLDERVERGQLRLDEAEPKAPTPVELLERLNKNEPRNPMNQWEAEYHRDKAGGAWTPDDAKHYDTEYSYFGWLEMLLQNEEITADEYLSERQRVRAAKEEE
jgi:hypothetical protein